MICDIILILQNKMSINYEDIDNVLKDNNINMNDIIDAFEQTIFDTYMSIRDRHKLPNGDTIYHLDPTIRKKYVKFDPKHKYRTLLIIEEVYKLVEKSIKERNIDKFLDPNSYRNRQEYINCNISTFFKITDTLFSDIELQQISVNPIFC
jgi:hypothetical protein